MFSSSIPAALLPALPFAFFTTSLDYISPVSLRTNPPPPDVSMSKYYYQSHLDEIKQKFEEVRALGGATAEEWFKGLEGTGKDRLADALRWEQWDWEGNLQRLHAFEVVKPHVCTTKSSPTTEPVQAQESQVQGQELTASSLPRPSFEAQPQGQPSAFPPAFAPLSSPAPALSPGQTQYGMGAPPPGAQPPFLSLPQKPVTTTTAMIPAAFDPYQAQQQLTRPVPMPAPIQLHVPQLRAERTIKDVNEARAQRRAEIERRCLELDPPIKPSTLVHMDAFAAAMQIPMRLTDQAWDVLKARLLSQREAAEGREQELLKQNQLLQARAEERRQQEAQLQAAKENMDRQWEAMQQPLREKLKRYADEIIQVQWSSGASITRDNCAQFAADVITYVRRRFYQLQEYEDQLIRATGQPMRHDVPGLAASRKLTLENMKWVYENKIKPFTEPYSREIFLCHGCDNSTKFYGFEGVIQHYAAKHTSLLSIGSVVVHWKADWPEDPPFDPNPSKVGKGISTSPISQTQGRTQFVGPNSYHPSINGRPFSSERQEEAPRHATPYSLPSTEQAPYSPSGSVQFITHVPPSAQSGSNHVLSSVHQQRPAYSHLPPQGHLYTSPASNWPACSHSPSDSTPFQSNFPQQPQPGSRLNWTSANVGHQGPRPSFAPHLGAPGQPFGIYQVQLEELSQNARAIFDGTSSIKDFPSSVRVFVIIAHVVLRFKDRFTNEPNLALFTDALNNSSKMQPLKALKDLACKTCSSMTQDQKVEHPTNETEPGKLYTLPDLLTHFQSVHIEQAKPLGLSQMGIELPRADWKFDMIRLPPKEEIVKVVDALGLTNEKLNIIANVLPGIFPSPLPDISNREPYIEPSEVVAAPAPALPMTNAWHHDSGPTPRSQAASNIVQSKLVALPSGGLEVEVDDYPKFLDSPAQDMTQKAEPAREDEYDPHRPAYIEPTPDSYHRYDHSKHRQKDQMISIGGMGPPSGVSGPRNLNAPANQYLSERRDRPPAYEQSRQPQTLSAAEAFLNNFEPGEDRDVYEPPEQVTTFPIVQTQLQAQQGSATSLQPLKGHNNTWSGIANIGSNASFNYRSYESNQNVEMTDDATRAPQYPSIEAHSRYLHGANDSGTYVDRNTRRSTSRIEDPDRHGPGFYRPRSRSPQGAQVLPVTGGYYGVRSPGRDVDSAYATEYIARDPDFYTQREYPQNDRVQYIQDHPQQQYVGRGYQNGSSYDAPVEYIRMPARQVHETPAYYLERNPPPAPAPAPAVGRYVQYEENVIEHNGQLYRRAPIQTEAPQRQYYH